MGIKPTAKKNHRPLGGRKEPGGSGFVFRPKGGGSFLPGVLYTRLLRCLTDGKEALSGAAEVLECLREAGRVGVHRAVMGVGEDDQLRPGQSILQGIGFGDGDDGVARAVND